MTRADKRSWSYWSPLTAHTCAALQGPLLEHAAQLLKPGGRLVYSTCTLAATENEDLIRDFLVNHPEFQVATHTPPTWMKTRSTRYGTTILVSDLHEGGFVSVLKKQG